MANEMDGLSVTCDLEDNGLNDASCAKCGNGIVEFANGESCDDAGESADCNPNCTLTFCGDGYVNATAGEQFRDMSDARVADNMAEGGGLGIATMLLKQFEGRL